MFGLGASQQSQDTQIVADYIRSRAMVEALGKSLDLRQIYSRDDADYFSRFDRTDSIEDLEKYWRKRVDVKIETLSGIVSVDVRAFTPKIRWPSAPKFSICPNRSSTRCPRGPGATRSPRRKAN